MAIYHEVMGEGPDLVLLHGWGMNSQVFNGLADALAQHHRVHLLDLPGFGLSQESAAAAHSLDNWLAQLVAALPARSHLLGWSLGGQLATLLALRWPERVKSLTVVDMAPVAYSQPRHSQVFAALNAVERAAPSDRRSAEALMSPYLPDSGVRQFLLKGFLRPEARQQAGSLSCWRFNLAAIEAAYPDLMGWEPVSGPYAGPTLFIKGGNSDYLTAEHQGRIMALFPAARARVVAGAGHWLHAEQPQLFERMLADFLAGAR